MNILANKEMPQIVKYRPDIDGLRAIAIGLVVLFHAMPQGFTGGFIGVDIFFVVSGYLITNIIVQQLNHDNFSLRVFYYRRINRLFPALILVLSFSLIAGWFFLVADEFVELNNHVASATTFISNFTYWSESGYFEKNSNEKILLHLWSLAVEEQFYIVWPIVLMLLVSFRKSNGIILLLVVSFGFNIYYYDLDPSLNFYSPFTRAWQLLAGAWLATNRDKYTNIDSTIQNSLSILGVLIILVATFFLSKTSQYPGYLALAPVVGAVLVISSQDAWFNRKILSNKIFILVGLVSYPLYLWHWPILVFLRLSYEDTPPRSFRIAAILISFLLAFITFKFLEKPLAKIKSEKKTVFLVAGMVLLFILSSGVLLNFKLNSAHDEKLYTSNAEVLKTFSEWKYTNNQACLDRYPYNKSKDFATWFCMLSKKSEPTILLLGNSYANQLYPGFVNNDKLSRHTIMSVGQCDPVKAVHLKHKGVSNPSPCIGKNRLSQEAFYEQIIENTQSIEYVVLDGVSREVDNDYLSRLKQRIDSIEKKEIRVIVFSPHLRLGFNPRACFTTPLRKSAKNCDLKLSEREKINENFQLVKTYLSQTNPQVLYFDQNEMYCNNVKCSMVKNGLPLARDYGHISQKASNQLQYYFTNWVEKNVPELFD